MCVWSIWWVLASLILKELYERNQKGWGKGSKKVKRKPKGVEEVVHCTHYSTVHIERWIGIDWTDQLEWIASKEWTEQDGLGWIWTDLSWTWTELTWAVRNWKGVLIDWWLLGFLLWQSFGKKGEEVLVLYSLLKSGNFEGWLGASMDISRLTSITRKVAYNRQAGR